MIRLPEEVLVFARLAAFGLIVGTVYWFIAYEPAGTVLLLVFGIATGVTAAVLWTRSRKDAGAAEDWLAGGEPGRIPAPAYAPLHVGIGAAIVALGLAFGPLLVLTGAAIMVIGGRYWLHAVMREADAAEAADGEVEPIDRR